MHAQIADQLFNAVIRQIAISAMQLQTVIGDLERAVGDVKLGHRAELAGVRRAIVQFPRRLTQEGTCGLQFDLHIRQTELQGLELVDRAAEGLTLTHIGQGLVQRGLRAAKGRGRDVQPSAIQPRHGIAEPRAEFAQNVGRGHVAIVHLDLCGRLRAPAHLVLKRAKGQAFRAVLNDQGGDAARAIVAGAGHDDIGIGIAAAGNKRFGSRNLV